MTKTLFTSALTLLSIALVAGCSNGPAPSSDADKSNSGAQSAGENAGAATAKVVELPDSQIKKIASTQKVCPISGGELGSMGTPVPVSVSDSQGQKQTVLLCCESCLPKLEENPEKYLAKLEEPQTEAGSEAGK